MNKLEAEALSGVLQPLLKTLDVLAFVGRHFHPPHFAQLMAKVGGPDEELRVAHEARREALSGLAELQEVIDVAVESTLLSFGRLRQVADGVGDLRDAYEAFGLIPDALEALYPLAGVLPPVSAFFTTPSLRGDAALQAALLRGDVPDNTGLMHVPDSDAGAADARDGFWLYLPETCRPGVPHPLVMALHGGSGSGRQFIWSWLRDARSHGAILVAPSSAGSTWALSGDDVDTPRLLRALSFVQSEWDVDPARLLLTGMSDGGTFTYLSGLATDSPFTHLAPVAAAFHPMLGAFVDCARVRGLPVSIVHGALDWMFPVAMAQEAQRVLSHAGAHVNLHVINDLSHTYPREINKVLLDWITPAGLGEPGSPARGSARAGAR
jgi:phospholipase/carboxylesterase